MSNETWQRLLLLETSDAVGTWHKALFKRELSARRIAEITSAARQGREFFRNAAQAHTSVRPLLSFYGVASLSRATLLLFQPGTGEAGLHQGHGLNTVNWSAALAGELPKALSAIDSLQVRTCAGLFSDFVRQTENHLCIHTRSSSVDWGISYDVPKFGTTITFGDLLSRLPDILSYLPSDRGSKAAAIDEITFDVQDGFCAKLSTPSFASIAPYFAAAGYQTSELGNQTELRCSENIFREKTPQFTHAYVKKMFGSIPILYIAQPFGSDTCYSQISLTYITSYFLGMLTRYFPTQWVALFSGTKGDSLWPAVSAAQRYVEECFPELILELIHYRVAQATAVK